MMNKDEAVQKLAKVARISVAYAEDLYDSFFPKPVVPQFVADWYEEHKERLDYELWEYLVSWDNQSPDRFKEWLNTDYEAIQTLVNMHQFGYEVEKEPRYMVRVKGIKRAKQWLVFSELTERWWFGAKEDSHYAVLEHTRKELEDAGFGEMFNNPLFEVKEVK